MTPGGGLVITNPTLHIDGNLDVTDDAACDSCHGGGGDPSPPQDIAGSVATTSRGVGAHREHLAGSSWRRQIQCAECHKVPTSNGAVGHMDTPLPSELTFTGIGQNTTWNGSTCTSYCHGSTLAGGSATAPVWTQVDGSQSACGSCHGLPPPPPHPAAADCESCHGDVIAAGLNIINPSLHIDGTLQVDSVHPPGWAEPGMHGADFNNNGPSSCATAACHGTALTGGASNISCEGCHSGWQTNCVFCHGRTDNMTGAPPLSLANETSRNVAAVGAHTAHVEAGATHVAYDCNRCHVKPSTALSPGHVEGTPGAEVNFSSLNSAGTYSGTTCSNMYCHGNGQGNNGSEGWTGDPTLGCGACHGSIGNSGSWDGMSGDHRKHLSHNTSCEDCHASVTSNGNNILSPGLHVDGNKQVQYGAGITMSWDPGTKACSGDCHGEEHKGDRW
jgi:predicted CxxxxCH...CXXCH cytochrome family protein